VKSRASNIANFWVFIFLFLLGCGDLSANRSYFNSEKERSICSLVCRKREITMKMFIEVMIFFHATIGF
jgi:hypothetical protein